MARLSRFAATLLLLAAGLAAPPAFAGKPYQYDAVGDPANVVRPHPAKPSLVLMGGGPDVDAAFAWMIAQGGGGNFVVIRSRGTDAYNPYIYAMGGVQSVETLVIPSRDAANDPFVIERIRGAEALFIAGGDQSDYINYWQGTPVQAAIQELAANNIPIGGTSAGMALLGKFGFSGLNGGVTSAEALANPFDKRITLERGFLNLPGMDGVIADSHLDARDRMGRLITFMARIVNDGWAGTVRGIGVDVDTALLVEDGQGRKVGTGAVYFLQTVGQPQVCRPRTPLTYLNTETQRLSGTGSFDLRNWAGYGGATTRYAISANQGVLTSTQPGGSPY
jgi:cyanophycinase